MAMTKLRTRIGVDLPPQNKLDEKTAKIVRAFVEEEDVAGVIVLVADGPTGSLIFRCATPGRDYTQKMLEGALMLVNQRTGTYETGPDGEPVAKKGQPQ
jgi:hypothetical protein